MVKGWVPARVLLVVVVVVFVVVVVVAVVHGWLFPLSLFYHRCRPCRRRFRRRRFLRSQSGAGLEMEFGKGMTFVSFLVFQWDLVASGFRNSDGRTLGSTS